MVPCDPCKTRAIGAEARRRIEIIPRNQNLNIIVALKIDAYQSVFSLTIRDSVIFAHRLIDFEGDQ